MIRSKGAIFGLLGALVLMTAIFTATSSDSLGERSVAADIDGLVVVNGDGVSEEEFTARVATVEQNVMMFRAQAEMNPEQSPFVEQFLEIMDGTPAETIALASLILDVAVYQEAISRGFLPDAETVASQVEQERTTFEMIEEDPEQFGVAREDIEEYREYIDSIGDDEYWGEFRPQQIEQQSAVERLQLSVSETGDDWLVTQKEIFEGASVDIRDEAAIAPATVSAAGDYLDSIWTLSAQS